MEDSGKHHVIDELRGGRDLARHLQMCPGDSSTSPESLARWTLAEFERTRALPNAAAPQPDSPRLAPTGPETYKNTSPRWTKQVRISRGMAVEPLPADGFTWVKHRQKGIPGAKFPRVYYRCIHRLSLGCVATKQMQRSDQDPTVMEITYRGEHTCKLASSQEQLLKTPDGPLTDNRGAMDISIQDHSNDKYVQFPEDTNDIFLSLNTPNPISIKKSGLGLTELPNDEAWLPWHSAVRLELADNKLYDLPLSPSSPVLEVLLLQGNVDLPRIPSTFFSKMPLLMILDLSYTSLRDLPDSLFDLKQLRQLYLKGCERFMKLSPQIGKLKKLEKLDLDGTQIIHMPEEIEELTNLESLFLCFYEYHGRKGKQYTCSTIIPSEVISKLKGLKHLSIDVNPDDERWYENVRDILPEILGLKHLLTLSLYIPHLELLKTIPDHMFHVDFRFRFIVGRHMKRIISSTPSTWEVEFQKSGCSLKFVNGDDVPYEIKRLVMYSKALFLERHKTVKSLLEFKMMNLEQLRVCILAECREMQTVVDGRQSNRGTDIFSHLLYLCISHMKSLRSIWEGPVPPRCFLGMLKSLVLQNCPELTTVFTMDFLGNLSLLKEFVVKNCPKVTTLISDESFKHKEVFLPKLRKIMLLHLPELITISNGCCIAPGLKKMAIYDCPKLLSLSKLELSSQTLEVIKGEIKWWDQLRWSKEEWGISQRPSRFDRIFSSIDNEVDAMTQIGNDGDNIDDDADMTLPQTIFERPKQNANNFCRKYEPERTIMGPAPKFGNIDVPPEDGFTWRKYGQKEIFGSINPRSYYSCTHQKLYKCPAKKRVQRLDSNPNIFVVTYKGSHTCHMSPSAPSSSVSPQLIASQKSHDITSISAPTSSQYNRSLHQQQSSEIESNELQYPSNENVDKDRSYMHKDASSLSVESEIFDDAADTDSRVDPIFSPINHKVDMMTQIGNDGDDSDDDAGIVEEPFRPSNEEVLKNNQANSSTQFGIDDNDTVHNHPALKYKAFRPSRLRINKDQKQFRPSRLRINEDQKQFAHASSRIRATITQASQSEETKPMLIYSIDQRANSASNADLESFFSMGSCIETAANETYGQSVDTN